MLSRPHAGVAGKRRRQFHDRAGVVGVVVVAGQQRRARGAAQRGGVEAVVPAARRPPASPASACWIGPPNALLWPKPMSSISTITTFGAPLGAFTSKRGGAFALRASSVGDRRGRSARGSAARCGRALPSPVPAPRQKTPSLILLERIASTCESFSSHPSNQKRLPTDGAELHCSPAQQYRVPFSTPGRPTVYWTLVQQGDHGYR